jgi:hypothetical protein
MRWTGINTSKTFEEVFQQEFCGYQSTYELIKHIELEIPPHLRDDNKVQESEFFCCFKNKAKGYKVGIVILFARNGKEVLWKEMDEGMVPYSKMKCPKEILDILSPIEQLDYPGYIKEWRERQ